MVAAIAFVVFAFVVSIAARVSKLTYDPWDTYCTELAVRAAGEYFRHKAAGTLDGYLIPMTCDKFVGWAQAVVNEP